MPCPCLFFREIYLSWWREKRMMNEKPEHAFWLISHNPNNWLTQGGSLGRDISSGGQTKHNQSHRNWKCNWMVGGSGILTAFFATVLILSKKYDTCQCNRSLLFWTKKISASASAGAGRQTCQSFASSRDEFRIQCMSAPRTKTALRAVENFTSAPQLASPWLRYCA